MEIKYLPKTNEIELISDSGVSIYYNISELLPNIDFDEHEIDPKIEYLLNPNMRVVIYSECALYNWYIDR